MTTTPTTPTTPFGPRLIGETEKTLNAILRRLLAGTGLTERLWVALRLADRPVSGEVGSNQALADEIADRARFDDASALVDQLAGRGLVDGGRPTQQGRAVLAEVQASIAAETAPVWRDLPSGDVEAATRVLNEVRDRARLLLT